MQKTSPDPAIILDPEGIIRAKEEDKKLATIMAKLKEVGAEYVLWEVQEYGSRYLNLPMNILEKTSGQEIAAYIHREMDRRYKPRV